MNLSSLVFGVQFFLELYLAALGLSCGIWDPSCGMWGFLLLLRHPGLLFCYGAQAQ